MTTDQFQQAPTDLHCEASITHGFGKTGCANRATYVYGPECERETGQLMYLCTGHAVGIGLWKDEHLNDPVECPTHGLIGKVKDYLILRKMQ